jgi:choline dehydrogenase-like flavoprotein
VTSPARAEFYKSFPLAAKDNLKLIKYILPGMMVMQVFYPCEAKDGADLSLNDDGSLKIVGKDIDFDSHQIKKILQIMRSLGAYSHSSIVQKIQKGLGIHYAGSLPMRMHPVGKYECDRAGKLNNSSGIYIVDGACFPDLPAKNYSFSIMANAMRIVDGINI